MIALVTANDLRPPEVSYLHLELPRQLQCSINGLRAPASKVDRTAAKVLPGKFQKLAGVLFGNRSGELTAVNKFEGTCLIGHGCHDCRYPMSDEVDGRGAGKVQILLALRIPQVCVLPAYRRREGLAKRAPQ